MGLRLGLGLVLLLGAVTASWADDEFPFEGELILDARPMPGSKRIPNMDIAADGKIELEMWCNKVDGQVVVAGDTLTVVTGTPTTRDCPPDRAQRDNELLDALAGVTGWKRSGDFVQFVGPKPLRFRVPTN